jgi:hypothetical protein
MTKYLYQIDARDPDAEYDEEETQLIIVNREFFEVQGHIDDRHILNDIIESTRDVRGHLDEIAESMFVSDLAPDALRKLLEGTGFFTEHTLVEND